MNNTISIDTQNRLTHILGSFNRDEALWAVKFLINRFSSFENNVYNRTPRKAKVVRRGRELNDKQLQNELSQYPDIDKIDDVDISAFVRANSGKALESFNNWL